MTTVPEFATYTFETSNHVLWAEDVAAEHGLTAQVIPAPATATAKCGLALRLPATSVERLEALLSAEGIRFHREPG